MKIFSNCNDFLQLETTDLDNLCLTSVDNCNEKKMIHSNMDVVRMSFICLDTNTRVTGNGQGGSTAGQWD